MVETCLDPVGTTGVLFPRADLLRRLMHVPQHSQKSLLGTLYHMTGPGKCHVGMLAGVD